MKPLDLDALTQFINNHINEFHDAKARSVQNMTLDKILKSKNPYLYRAKNLISPSAFIESIIDAHISSSEEEKFGEFLERVALFIAEQTMDAIKSIHNGVDLEFIENGNYYLVQVKSGTNWGNSSQQKKLVQDFDAAIQLTHAQYPDLKPQAVQGSCYGKRKTHYHKNHLRLAGQSFWHFLSGNPNLYIDLIEPFAYRAKTHNDYFLEQRLRVTNLLTQEMMGRFLVEGLIDWEKVVRFNSGNGEVHA